MEEISVRIDDRLASSADAKALIELLQERGISVKPTINHYTLDYALAQARAKGWMQ